MGIVDGVASWLSDGYQPEPIDRAIAWFTVVFTIPLATIEFAYWFLGNL